MATDYTFTRRRFIGVTAGALAASALAPAGAALGADPTDDLDRGYALVPRPKMGTITFTQRDVPSRLGIAGSAAAGVDPTFGYMGGPNFPQDPTDLGPLVPLPGGWYELFGFLAGLGYKQIEFAGYNQNSGNPGGSAPSPAPGGVTTPESRAAYLAYGQTLRGFLDEFGLEAIGNHGFIPNTWPGPNSPNGEMSENDFNRFMTELEFASILGMPYMGTGGDPTSANNRNIEPWDISGEKWTAINDLSMSSFGIQMYPHNHSPAYAFLQDGPMVEVTEDRQTGEPIAPTMVRAESGKRLMQHYLDITDPVKIVVELDIYWAHVAQHQHRWRYDYDGNRVEDIFDPFTQLSNQPHRYVLFHSKDGDRNDSPPGEGSGYSIVPFGTGDIQFGKWYNRIKRLGTSDYHNSNYEQDNAPGGSSDRGQSLRHAKISAFNMRALG